MSPTFATFLLASLVLAILPGPGVIYILTRTLRQGRAAGLASVCGIALGNLANAVVASLGLAIVIAASATAFTAVKIMGAAYLVFLGFQALRSKAAAEPTDAESADEHALAMLAPRLFRDGFLVALLNPKTAVFFAAFLPQFIHPAAAPLAQTLFLGCVFVAIALCTDTVYVFAAAALASTLRRSSRWRFYGRYLSAAAFFGLGVYAALAGARARR